LLCLLFVFTAPPPPPFYTLSLHDALPISQRDVRDRDRERALRVRDLDRLDCDPVAELLLERALDEVLRRRDELRSAGLEDEAEEDRKSTRLNSSHLVISYAVFCLKKKKKK